MACRVVWLWAVQISDKAVKSCYKTKSRSGVLRRREMPDFVPSDGCAVPFRLQEGLGRSAKGAQLHLKRNALAARKGHSCSAKGTQLQRKRGTVAWKKAPFDASVFAHFIVCEAHCVGSQPLAAARLKLAKNALSISFWIIREFWAIENANIVHGQRFFVISKSQILPLRLGSLAGK